MAAMQGFTWDQWKELERQATIYKYMVASLPIPPHLILPLLNPATTTPTPTPTPTPFDGSTSTLSSSIFELRSSRDKDPEPGRCKRTDGKKWRCSRDVAPHHKYCERHMNRGRPRSRKPVEHKNKQNASLPNNSTPTPTSGLDWTMETQMLTREHQRQHFMPSIYNSSSSVSQSSYGGDPLSYMHFGNSNHFQDNEDYNLLMNPNMGSLLNPRSFIDAWSNDKPYADNVSPHGNLSPSSLNLSMTMAVGNEDMGIIDDVETPNPSQGSSWSSPVSWVGSTAGGPLGEALLSTYAGSPPATAVSSPSGVVHKNVLSRSDSSVCNSPTLAASNATPETVFFQWIG